MTQAELNQRAEQAILKYSVNEAKAVASDAIAQKADLMNLINEGFTKGINQIGELYEQKKVFLPDIMAAARAMNAGIEIINPYLGGKAVRQESIGSFVICTIEGDIHSIGKDLCAIMLQVAGFDVVNLGRDIPPREIAQACADHKAVAVGTSALMTSTMVNQKAFEDVMRKRGLKGKCVTNVGGGPVTQQWADEIGADIYSENVTDLVSKMIKAIKG